MLPKKGLFLLLFIIFNSNLFANKDLPLQKISLLLQWKHQFQFAGYYIAKEKGFYKNANLDVNIKEFEFGLDVAEEVKNKKVDFAIGKSSLLINSSNGDDIVLLAVIYQSSPHILLALKNNGIKAIEDIKAKKIMMTGDAKDDATFLSMLFSRKVKKDSVIFQEHSFNLEDLVNKNTDLMASYISNEPYRLKEEYGLDSIIFDPKDYGFDIYNDILFTSSEYIENNPKKVSKFLDASLKGWEYAFSNIEESVDIILNKYNTQDKSKEALLFEAKELKKLAYYNTSRIGEIKKEKIEKTFHTYKVMGLSSNEIDLNKLIYDRKSLFLNKKEKAYLTNKKELSLCIPDLMPYTKVDKYGNHIGISSDILNSFKKKIDINFKAVNTNTKKETLAAISNKSCDIVPLAYESKTSKKYMNFTSPFLEVSYALATKYDVTFVNNFNQIKTGKIAYLEHCNFAKEVQYKYPHLEFISVHTIEEGMKKIVNNEVFGLFITLEELSYSFPPEYSHLVKIGGKLEDKVSFSIGIRDDEPILLSIFDKLVKTLSPREKEKILNKYMSIRYEEKTDFEFLFQTILIFLFICLLLIYFLVKQNRLKREIEGLNRSLRKRVSKEVEKNRQKDKALYRQARLASLGEMIGNIAHQWRQPLNRINLSAQGIKFLLEEENISNPEVNKRIKYIEKNISYMSDTIEDFRNFFNPAKQMENFDIQEVLLKAFKLLDKRVCDLHIILPKNKDIKVLGYKNEFLQVILVILHNALDNFELNKIDKRKEVIVKIKGSEDCVNLSINDNSGGIPSAIIDRVFEPYFTTKFKQEGSGVGLYMAKMVIEKSMNGKLEVESRDEETTFIISLERKGI